MTVHTAAEAPSRPGVAASVVDATKVYGIGATEVRAVDHVTLDFTSGGRKAESSKLVIYYGGNQMG